MTESALNPKPCECNFCKQSKEAKKLKAYLIANNQQKFADFIDGLMNEICDQSMEIDYLNQQKRLTDASKKETIDRTG